MFEVSTITQGFALDYVTVAKDKIRIVSDDKLFRIDMFGEVLNDFVEAGDLAAVRHLLQAEDLSKLDLDRIIKDLEES